MKIGIVFLTLAFSLFSPLSQASFLNFGPYETQHVDQAIFQMEVYEFQSVMSGFIEEAEKIIDSIQTIKDLFPSNKADSIGIMELFSQIDTAPICSSCQSAVLAMRSFADQKIIQDIAENYGLNICLKKNYNATVCRGMIQEYGSIIFNVLLNRTFNSVHACQKFFLCPRTTTRDNLTQYIEEVLSDKPPTNIPVPTKRSTYKILHLTDPHIDMEYQEGLASTCTAPLCCRPGAGLPDKESDASQYWGTLAECDIPMRTFEQFLEFASSNLDIDMIIWTGDNIQHNIWNQSIPTQTQNTYNATQDLMKYFPNTPVFPMFGNHEAFPCDQFDFIGNNSLWLTSQLSEMWQAWLDEEAFNTFANTSYYSMVDAVRNVKVIALDTVACDSLDFYLEENPTDPHDQLAWLRAQLYDSESKNQSVILMGHIPPGNFKCDSEWSARYTALVDRFTNIIRAQMFGHTHNDQLEMVRSYKDSSPVGVVYIAPSMTTYSALNPSFRVFEMDTDTNVVLNYYQYRLDLNKWNQVNTTGPIQWDLAYDFLSEYNLPDMSFQSVDSLVDSFQVNMTTVQTYFANVNSGGPYVEDVKPRTVQHLYCGSKYSVSEDAFACLGLNATTADLMDIAQQVLPGGWSFAHC